MGEFTGVDDEESGVFLSQGTAQRSGKALLQLIGRPAAVQKEDAILLELFLHGIFAHKGFIVAGNDIGLMDKT